MGGDCIVKQKGVKHSLPKKFYNSFCFYDNYSTCVAEFPLLVKNERPVKTSFKIVIQLIDCCHHFYCR